MRACQRVCCSSIIGSSCYDEACQSCRGQGGTRCGIHRDDAKLCTVCAVCHGVGSFEVTEMRPRRFAWLIRPLYRPEPIEG